MVSQLHLHMRRDLTAPNLIFPYEIWCIFLDKNNKRFWRHKEPKASLDSFFKKWNNIQTKRKNERKQNTYELILVLRSWKNFLSLHYIFSYQENSHPENSHLENSHQSNSLLVNYPQIIPTQKIPTWNIPTHVKNTPARVF